MIRDELQEPARPIFDLINQEEFAQAITQATAMLPKSQGTLKEDLHRLIGLSYFLTGRPTNAAPHFVQGGNSTDNLFNLAVCSVVNGAYAQAEIYFTQCGDKYTEEKNSGNYQGYSGAVMQFTFASHLVEKKQEALARKYLDNLASIYLQLKITDYSFLGIRDVPAFSAFVEVLVDYFQLPGAHGQQDMLRNLHDNLDDEARRVLGEYFKI